MPFHTDRLMVWGRTVQTWCSGSFQRPQSMPGSLALSTITLHYTQVRCYFCRSEQALLCKAANLQWHLPVAVHIRAGWAVTFHIGCRSPYPTSSPFCNKKHGYHVLDTCCVPNWSARFPSSGAQQSSKMSWLFSRSWWRILGSGRWAAASGLHSWWRTELEFELESTGFRPLSWPLHPHWLGAAAGSRCPLGTCENNGPVSYVAQSGKAKQRRRDMQSRTG